MPKQQPAPLKEWNGSKYRPKWSAPHGYKGHYCVPYPTWGHGYGCTKNPQRIRDTAKAKKKREALAELKRLAEIGRRCEAMGHDFLEDDEP